MCLNEVTRCRNKATTATLKDYIAIRRDEATGSWRLDGAV